MADIKLGSLFYSVFYLAGEFARHLQRQAQEDFPSKCETLFTNGEVICAEIAGLCHDLGALHFVLSWFRHYFYNYSYASHIY